jgi:hypothetical protein
MRDTFEGHPEKLRIKMKKLFLCLLLAASTASIAAADSIQVVSGGTTITVPGTGAATYSNANFKRVGYYYRRRGEQLARAFTLWARLDFNFCNLHRRSLFS